MFGVSMFSQCRSGRSIVTLRGLHTGIYDSMVNVEAAVKSLEQSAKRFVILEDSDTDGFKCVLYKLMSEDFPKFWRAYHLSMSSGKANTVRLRRPAV